FHCRSASAAPCRAAHPCGMPSRHPATSGRPLPALAYWSVLPTFGPPARSRCPAGSPCAAWPRCPGSSAPCCHAAERAYPWAGCSSGSAFVPSFSCSDHPRCPAARRGFLLVLVAQYRGPGDHRMAGRVDPEGNAILPQPFDLLAFALPVSESHQVGIVEEEAFAVHGQPISLSASSRAVFSSAILAGSPPRSGWKAPAIRRYTSLSSARVRTPVPNTSRQVRLVAGCWAGPFAPGGGSAVNPVKAASSMSPVPHRAIPRSASIVLAIACMLCSILCHLSQANDICRFL